MNEQLRHAMASIAAVTERAGHLTRDEQEALAVQLEAFAERLRWEQWFHLPQSYVAEQTRGDGPQVAAVALWHAPHG